MIAIREKQLYAETRGHWHCYIPPVDVEAEVERVGRELAEWVRRTGTPLFELSRDLGRHPNYLSRAFRGRLRLKVWDAFAILREVHGSPRQFFTWLYPFGGPAAAAVESEPRYQAQADRSLETLLLKQEEKLGHTRRDPADWTARVRALLRDLLRRRKLRQQQASLALGLGPKALGQVLQGQAQLTFEHLFGVLAYAETPPGRFFFELFGAPEGDAFAELRWVRYLDALEIAYPRAVAATAAAKGWVEAPGRPELRSEATQETDERRPRGRGRPARRRRPATED